MRGWSSWLGRFAVALSGAFSLWAFIVNRTLIQQEDHPGKHLLVVLFGVVLAGVSAASVLRWERAAPLAWLLLLSLFGAGEIHRAWLRSDYQANSRSTPLWPAVTTADIEVRTFQVAVPALHDARVRIAHLTDPHIHANAPPALSEALTRALHETKPDLLLFTGDFISRPERLPELERWLAKLPRAPLGSFAVLGNHDYWTGVPERVRASLVHAGFTVLSGRCDAVMLPGVGPLALCGTEAPWGPDYAGPNGAPVATLALSHTPDNVYRLAERGVTAVFSGHTHAGQVRLPLLGAVIVPSDYGRRFDEGHFQIGHTHLFVSAGIGADAPSFRLWCRPELIVVDLVAGD